MVEKSCLPCEDAADYEDNQILESIKNTRSSESAQDSNNSRGKRSSSSGYNPPSKLKKRLYNHVELIRIIYQFLAVPFESTCQLKEWVNDDYLAMYDNKDREYQLATTTVTRRTQFLTFEELLKVHESATNPKYYARSDNHYYNVDDSYAILMELLTFQFPIAGELKSFIVDLYNILERKYPKMNSVYIEGPASAGKTYFATMICGFYLNVGHVKNIVRGQNFPLNDCVNRRLLVWNEPNCCTSAYDTVKMIAGGDPCPAAVKYQGDSVISKTPLLLTGNNCIFDKRKDVWNSRIKFVKWKTAPFLKNCKQYIHPMAYVKLIKQFIE
jgi:hypothetical protein